MCGATKQNGGPRSKESRRSSITLDESSLQQLHAFVEPHSRLARGGSPCTAHTLKM